MEKSRHYSWLLAMLSTLLTLGLHAYLGLKFYSLRFGALGQSSACNINELWNCDAVSASSYAQFLGVPLAIWGLSTHIILALFLILSRLGWIENEERGQRYTAWITAIVVLASIVMAFISVTMLHTLCLFCVMTYGLSILTALGVYFWAKPSVVRNISSDVAALFSDHRGILTGLIAIPGSAFLLNSMFIDNFQGEKMNIMAVEKVAQWTQAPTKNFAADQGLVEFKGTGTPKMEIVEFADFRCSHCKEAYFTLEAFTASHPDVKLTFKYYPLDGTCNPAPELKGNGDGISCEAAFITHCSEKLFKKGWKTHHALFDNQEVLRTFTSKDEVSDFVCKETQSDCAQLKVCTASIETRNEIQAMVKEGMSAGVQGTPSIFVNNRQLIYGQFLPVLEKAYETLHSNE